MSTATKKSAAPLRGGLGSRGAVTFGVGKEPASKSSPLSAKIKSVSQAIARKPDPTPSVDRATFKTPGEPPSVVAEIESKLEPFRGYYPTPNPTLDQSDQEWLESLPLLSKLHGAQKRIFIQDALAYRHTWAQRQAFAEAFLAYLKTQQSSRCPGESTQRAYRWLDGSIPENWRICGEGDERGCGGTGRFGDKKCRKCRGNGYRVGRTSYLRKSGPVGIGSTSEVAP